MTSPHPTKIRTRSKRRTKAKLIDATLQCLMEGGADACSARKVCERADVSIGLINYHFSSMQGLIAAAYRDLALTMLDNAAVQSEASDEDPRQQLSEFVNGIFAPGVMDKKTLKAWIVFWGMIDTSPVVKAAHESTSTAFWSFLNDLFQNLAKTGSISPSPKMAAIGLTAMIDGLWLEWCLDSESFNPQDAVNLCEIWIDAVWTLDSK